MEPRRKKDAKIHPYLAIAKIRTRCGFSGPKQGEICCRRALLNLLRLSQCKKHEKPIQIL